MTGVTFYSQPRPACPYLLRTRRTAPTPHPRKECFNRIKKKNEGDKDHEDDKDHTDFKDYTAGCKRGVHALTLWGYSLV